MENTPPPDSDLKFVEYYHPSVRITILVLLFCIAFLLFQAVVFENTWDDAYISYRYSRNFVENNGLVYNIGERVEGYTTFLWVMIIGLIGKTGLDIPTIGKVMSMLFGLATLIVTYFIGLSLGKKYYTAALLCALFLAIRIDFGVHYQSGMETSLHAFILSLAYLIYLKNKRRLLIPLGILAGLLQLVHPEGIIFTVAFIITELMDTPGGAFKIRLKNIGLFILPVGLIVISHLVWRYFYYGDLLPNTYYAKSPGLDLIKYIRGTWYLAKFFIFGGGFLYYLPGLYFLYACIRNKQVRMLAIIISLYLLFNVYASGDWSPYSRFMMPVLPLVIVSVIYGILKLASALKAGKLALAFVVMVFLVTGYQSGLVTKVEPTVFIGKHRKQRGRWKVLCEEFRKIKAKYPDLTIASNPIGMVGYYSEARIIDMLGLTNKHIAKEGRQIMGAPGHERWDMDYVLNQKPDIIYPGSYLVTDDGKVRPRLGLFTSEEDYARIDRDYEMVNVPDAGQYWIKKSLKATLPPDEFEK